MRSKLGEAHFSHLWVSSLALLIVAAARFGMPNRRFHRKRYSLDASGDPGIPEGIMAMRNPRMRSRIDERP